METGFQIQPQLIIKCKCGPSDVSVDQVMKVKQEILQSIFVGFQITEYT